MSSLRDKIKQAIKDQLTGIGWTNPSKYRLGVVTALNPDGTCLALLDGNAIQALPTYPVVQGQQVIVVLGDGGTYTVIPTSPAPGIVPLDKPPFFTSPSKFRIAAFEIDTTVRSGVFPVYIRLQDSGSNKIYRLVLPTPASPPSNFSQPDCLTLSPDGRYLAYAEGFGSTGFSNSWPTPPSTINYRYRIYDLGAGKLQSSGPIPGISNGFFLQATLKSEFLVQGLALSWNLYANWFEGGGIGFGFGTSQYSVPALFLTNDPFLFSIEFLDKEMQLAGPLGSITASTVRNYISFESGSRAVLATDETVHGVSNGSGSSVISGSGITSGWIQDTTKVSGSRRNGTFDATVGIVGAHPAGEIGPLLYDKSFSFVSTIEPSGGGTQQYILAPASQMIGTKVSCVTYFIDDLSFNITAIKFFTTNYADGSVVDYLFSGNPNTSFPIGPPELCALLTDKTSSGSTMFNIFTDVNNSLVVALYKVTLDNVHNTVSLGSPLTGITPNPDSGYTSGQFRTGLLGTVSVPLLNFGTPGYNFVSVAQTG
jgi:hypothetical protein